MNTWDKLQTATPINRTAANMLSGKPKYGPSDLVKQRWSEEIKRWLDSGVDDGFRVNDVICKALKKNTSGFSRPDRVAIGWILKKLGYQRYVDSNAITRYRKQNDNPRPKTNKFELVEPEQAETYSNEEKERSSFVEANLVRQMLGLDSGIPNDQLEQRIFSFGIKPVGWLKKYRKKEDAETVIYKALFDPADLKDFNNDSLKQKLDEMKQHEAEIKKHKEAAEALYKQIQTLTN